MTDLTPTPPVGREALEKAIHRGIMPEFMTVANAIGSQEHYNEFIASIADALIAAGLTVTPNPTWFCSECGHPWPVDDGNPNEGKWDRCTICNNDEWKEND